MYVLQPHGLPAVPGTALPTAVPLPLLLRFRLTALPTTREPPPLTVTSLRAGTRPSCLCVQCQEHLALERCSVNISLRTCPYVFTMHTHTRIHTRQNRARAGGALRSENREDLGVQGSEVPRPDHPHLLTLASGDRATECPRRERWSTCPGALGRQSQGQRQRMGKWKRGDWGN